MTSVGKSLLVRMLGIVALIALRLLKLTYRFQFINLDRKQKAFAYGDNQCVVYGLWHQNAVATILGHAGQAISTLISQSKDGEIIAYACERLGYRPVRGSSSRGGGAAKANLVSLVDEGYSPALTVDGPKGPRHQAKPGVVHVASEAKIAILGVAGVADRYWEFNSWDRFRLPKPFAKIIVGYGEPLVVTENELARETIGRYLNELNSRLNNLELEIGSAHAAQK